MNIIVFIYTEIFFRPLFNALIFLTGILPFHDLGFAVIILTLVVRGALFPFTHRSVKTQVQMKKIEPELRKIRDEFKNDQQEQARRTMQLYKEHGVSPFSGCLMLLVQLPILIALYRVFILGIADIHPEALYSFVSMPLFINIKFLNLIDLTQKSIIFAFLAAGSQYVQLKLAVPPSGKKDKKTGSFGDELSQVMAKQSMYIFPVFIFFITLRFPSAVALYWTTMNIFAIVHESIVRKKAKKFYGGEKKQNTKGNADSS